ncbi:unnamed protein product [Spodoptera littoralis]|uniref:Uncharacterized protein n=1 Tax=Spodoptera littoralis TaxID=7109 RepID=A0A9P0HY07_SPOLI|nr:unnamed protein product [Spodoptera littoralis]CAH1635875.1 unnamed protein product [Spodoptera littoralis]
MANPNFRQDGDKNVLNTVVLWCCCGFFFIICGYGLYRQHTLEQRVLVLEQHFQELRRAAQVQEPSLAAGPELSRKERDVGDCICPAEHCLSQPAAPVSSEEYLEGSSTSTP